VAAWLVRLGGRITHQTEGEATLVGPSGLTVGIMVSDPVTCAIALGIMSGVSLHTGKGFLSLTWGNERGQLDVDTARQMAMDLLKAAEAADHDATLFAWLCERKLLPSPEAAAALLNDVRAWREARPEASYQREHPLTPPEEET
jgi:hypothetical protein